MHRWPNASWRVIPAAIARAISLIEDESPAGAELVRDIYPRTGRAYLIGVTGPRARARARSSIG